MAYAPFNYEQLNLEAGTYSPSPIKSRNNKSYDFWVRSLFQRACSTLEFNLPKEWEGAPRDFLLYCLFKAGYVAIFDNPRFGVTFQPGTLSGMNWYYMPTNICISNPALNTSLNLEIGKDCEILKLTPDYRGVWDIIDYYAGKLSTLDNAINMSLINNKFAFFLGARNKAAGEAIKKMLDKVNKGEPAVIYDMKLLNDPTDKAEPWQIIERDLRKTYLTTEQLADFQTILNGFDAEIGIPTLPYANKKERMITDEAQTKQIDGMSRSIVWFDTLTSSIKKCKELIPGLQLDVKLRYNEDDQEEIADE